ncbi:hypothetical protein [Chitinophaga sp. HK235]|uniref:hypothetical protein n=1 Tax=Chitinophaga sp. HK235 TaxID=2952571 RepID=UPI001BAD4BB6|nr:hypothetical protein [Chitinophaga sp. HK235]
MRYLPIYFLAVLLGICCVIGCKKDMSEVTLQEMAAQKAKLSADSTGHHHDSTRLDSIHHPGDTIKHPDTPWHPIDTPRHPIDTPRHPVDSPRHPIDTSWHPRPDSSRRR